jgi:ribose 5-phosphate isomerase B
MIVAFGCDHAGFPLKERLAREVERVGHSVMDCGVFDETPVDYPDIAREVGDAVRRERASRGLLVCGSGVGVSIAANKLQGVRAALCHDTFSARQGVEDDALNVLCLGARVIGAELAADVVRAFLDATFSGEERHVRRLAKIEALVREERIES